MRMVLKTKQNLTNSLSSKFDFFNIFNERGWNFWKYLFTKQNKEWPEIKIY
jgi:hypothetical protein